MGYGSYSYDAHESLVKSRAHKSRDEVFAQRSVHPLMDPHGVKFRESRDSAAHPFSIPIMFALDVTGSMGAIPELLAKKELPHFMKTLLAAGVTDPQVLFMFVGDFASDDAPLQVGQFESAAEEMDRWLTWSYLEGGGGGNGCESYDLAMYFAARHTVTDSLEKRHRRGYFFMTGDEKPYPVTSSRAVKPIIADGLTEDVPLAQVCQELASAYQPFFLIPDPQRRAFCEDAWRAVFGDHVIPMEQPEDTCLVSAALVALCEGAAKDLDELARAWRAEELSRERIGGLVRALTPFASTLGRDGVLAPKLEPVMFR